MSGTAPTPAPAADAEHGLSAPRLTDVLRAEGFDVDVVGLDVSPVGTGQMAGSYRLRPTYAGDRSGLPDTFVAKVAGGDPSQRQAAAGTYRTEVGFYRRLAPTVAVRVPRCWHASIADDGGDFLLLLEDLHPAEQGDQLGGCTVDQARAAVVNLAGLHGPRWCDASLEESAGLNPVDLASVDLLGAFLTPSVEGYLAAMGDRVSAEDAEVLRRVPEVVGPWINGRGERFGPVHGDYRLDNLMFAPDGAVTALDWQTLSIGLPARDLAFFCSTGLRVDDRRAHEQDLVAAYHAALVGHGTDGYPLDLCLDDYRYSMLQAPLIIVLGWTVSARTERGDRMFLAMTERSCAAIRDHGTLDLVDR